jgi:hypothetical protein
MRLASRCFNFSRAGGVFGSRSLPIISVASGGLAFFLLFDAVCRFQGTIPIAANGRRMI